jgi:hypothetical protein
VRMSIAAQAVNVNIHDAEPLRRAERAAAI